MNVKTVFSPCTVAVVGLVSVGRLIFFQVPVSLWIAECFCSFFVLCFQFSYLYEVSSRAVLPQQDTTGTCYRGAGDALHIILYTSSDWLPATLSWNVLSSWRHVSMEMHSCYFMCIIACWCNQIKLIMHSITVLICINSVKLPFNLLFQDTLFYVKHIIAPCTQRVNAFVCNALFLTMFNILN